MIITGLIITMNATSQTWSWTAALGGRSNADGSIGMDRDATGNVYVCGDFEGTRNFGGTTLTAAAFSDFYFSKFNSAGAHQWTNQLSGTGTTTIIANSIATDAAGRYEFCVPAGAASEPLAYVCLFARGLLNHHFSAVFAPDCHTHSVLAQVPDSRRASLMATLIGTNLYRWDVHLQGTQETVFFDYV